MDNTPLRRLDPHEEFQVGGTVLVIGMFLIALCGAVLANRNERGLTCSVENISLTPEKFRLYGLM